MILSRNGDVIVAPVFFVGLGSSGSGTDMKNDKMRTFTAAAEWMVQQPTGLGFVTKR